MRWATIVTVVLVLAGCTDVRDFRGRWDGPRVGDAGVLRVGPGDAATLAIDAIDAHGLTAHLAIANLMPETAIASMPGAEADVLANLTFAGNPLRVFLAFAPLADGAGDALVVIALYDDHRIEVRVLRGGASPVYAIFALAEAGAS